MLSGAGGWWRYVNSIRVPHINYRPVLTALVKFDRKLIKIWQNMSHWSYLHRMESVMQSGWTLDPALPRSNMSAADRNNQTKLFWVYYSSFPRYCHQRFCLGCRGRQFSQRILATMKVPIILGISDTSLLYSFFGLKLAFFTLFRGPTYNNQRGNQFFLPVYFCRRIATGHCISLQSAVVLSWSPKIEAVFNCVKWFCSKLCRLSSSITQLLTGHFGGFYQVELQTMLWPLWSFLSIFPSGPPYICLE